MKDRFQRLLSRLVARTVGAFHDRRRPDPPAALPTFPSSGTAPIQFPADHGFHVGYVAEWWYFNGQLWADNRPYGYHVCFFCCPDNIRALHVSLTDISAEKHLYLRTILPPAEITAASNVLDLKYGDASVCDQGTGALRLVFGVDGNRLELELAFERGPLMVNGNGIVEMPDGGDSRYYSITRLKTEGVLVSPGGSRTPVTGRTWFDHQWGNFAVISGWDWFAFQMDDGTDYNLSQGRVKLGRKQTSLVNVLTAGGDLQMERDLVLERLSWWKSPHTNKHYVTAWRVRIPARHEVFDVTSCMLDQEMPQVNAADVLMPYWEGAVRVVRYNADKSVTHGVGYSEQMPYDRPA